MSRVQLSYPGEAQSSQALTQAYCSAVVKLARKVGSALNHAAAPRIQQIPLSRPKNKRKRVVTLRTEGETGGLRRHRHVATRRARADDKEGTDLHAAATTSCQVLIAAARSTRCD
jgi:hypothetical protein